MASLKVRITAGPHARHACPVSVPIELPPGTVVSVVDVSSGKIAPGQVIQEAGKVSLVWVVPSLQAGEVRDFVVDASQPSVTGAVTLTPLADHQIAVSIGSSLFTTYHFGPDLARPYCYPLNDPTGSCVTRGAAGEKPGETTDHVHHRSLWTAYGEVNDTDNWSEEAGHGRTVHTGFDLIESGPVVGRLRARSDWKSSSGSASLLHETREFRFYNTDDDQMRLFDYLLDLEAVEDVHFGDTKEGGFLSVRVATSIDAALGGKIENSYGGIGEGECWGRRANWCDYSGLLDGHWAGIAVMEHPDTFRSPTYWHVRDYGLMGTNPFGGATFTSNPALNGAFTLSRGERLRFLYRVSVHLGDAGDARIADVYHGFVNPPKVEQSG